MLGNGSNLHINCPLKGPHPPGRPASITLHSSVRRGAVRRGAARCGAVRRGAATCAGYNAAVWDPHGMDNAPMVEKIHTKSTPVINKIIY